ncbi:hypothetical protein OE699_13710 [Sedimentimonas flavescens]|uniref:Transposase n=1 Tax=Sedimentimonas flavescens TaxID=2851012 RepID=A0ABT3A1M7_9RHOB|nr:hypothetical protein [Sedimentimonas flavescens]MCV2879903.1 hypothetical protein [Sedimentimonas flavescens]
MDIIEPAGVVGILDSLTPKHVVDRTHRSASGPPPQKWSAVMIRKTEGHDDYARHKPEEIVTKLRQVEVLVGQGVTRVDAIRQVRVTEQTYYRWRKKLECPT